MFKVRFKDLLILTKYNIEMETINKKTMNYKTVKEVVDFCKLTKTEQSNRFAGDLQSSIKMDVGKNYYIYNETTKLWEYNSKSCFYTFLCNYLANCINTIKTVCSTANIKPFCCCEVRRKECSCNGNQISIFLDKLDSSTYIDLIEKRALGILIDPDFVKQLNCSNDSLPIKDGKKINFKTLEVTDRTSEDYYSFFCNVELVKKTPNADRLFKDLMPIKEHREYLRKCLGYMITGDTTARCFFCCYGNGSNGKTLVMGQLLKEILSTFYHTCDQAVFVKSNYTGGASPHLFALLNKRGLVYSEGETADEMDLNMTVIKGISGEDD